MGGLEDTGGVSVGYMVIVTVSGQSMKTVVVERVDAASLAY